MRVRRRIRQSIPAPHLIEPRWTLPASARGRRWLHLPYRTRESLGTLAGLCLTGSRHRIGAWASKGLGGLGAGVGLDRCGSRRGDRRPHGGHRAHRLSAVWSATEWHRLAVRLRCLRRVRPACALRDPDAGSGRVRPRRSPVGMGWMVIARGRSDQSECVGCHRRVGDLEDALASLHPDATLARHIAEALAQRAFLTQTSRRG